MPDTIVLFLVIRLSAGMPDDRIIPASEVETKIRAGEPAEFDDCTIVGDLNLSALRIEGPVHFNYTIFRDSVNFESTTFNGYAYSREPQSVLQGPTVHPQLMHCCRHR